MPEDFKPSQNMPLSASERALVESAYNRRHRGRPALGGFAAVIMVLSINSTWFIKLIENPHSSHLTVAIVSGLIGLALGMCLLSSIFNSRQRKRDEELIRFVEKHFPDECSWKQEEKILDEAKNIELKAKLDSLKIPLIGQFR